MSQPIQAILFDLDGVVVFTDKYHYLAWKQLADEMGWEFDEEVNDGCRGVPRLASLQVILDHNGIDIPHAEKERLAAVKNGYYKELLKKINEDDVYPGVIPFLDSLKQMGLRLAICSSSRNALPVLEALELLPYFDAVITGNDIERPKPDPEIFLKGAEALGMPPENCLVFEDAESGVEAAHAAGMPCVGVGPAGRLTQADLTMRDYAELDIRQLVQGSFRKPDRDPFKPARTSGPVLECEFQGEKLPMLLRHADVQEAAKDWETYSSDAPFRVPIPSEEAVRSVRQLPIETDPPEHAKFRAISDPFFKRPRLPEVRRRMEERVAAQLGEALDSDRVEVVREFALPLQSRALTILLDVPEREADKWIGWGIHVFRDGPDGKKKGAVLEDYIVEQLERARRNPGEDFFSALVSAKFDGRSLTQEEMMGFANLAFAGGRDTIIQTVAGIFGYFADHPDALDGLRAEPRGIPLAAEEFFRILSPLTHIGRTCPRDTDVHGTQVKAKGRVSLCWASANSDEAVFENSSDIQLDRKPNPHLAFGAGAHFCQGAFHARLVTRTLLEQLCQKVGRIEIHERRELVEREEAYSRIAGYESLTVTLVPMKHPTHPSK